MPTIPSSNNVIMTINNDKTASLDDSYIGNQQDIVTITVNVGTDISSSGYDAYVDFIEPDGGAFFKGPYDCSSGTFNFQIGYEDSLMNKDGILSWQFGLATTVGLVRTFQWLADMQETKILTSIEAELPVFVQSNPIGIVLDASNISYDGSVLYDNVEKELNHIETEIVNLNFTGSEHDALVTGALIDSEGVDFGEDGLATYLDGRHNKWENKVSNILEDNVISAKNPPSPSVGIDEADADLSIKLNTLLAAYDHVFVPAGTYSNAHAIIIPATKKLELDSKVIINHTSLTENVFVLNHDCEFDGNRGIVNLDYTYSGAVFYMTNHVDYCHIRNLVVNGLSTTEIATGVCIYMDGSDAGKNGTNCHSMFNTFKDIDFYWIGTGIKIESNLIVTNPTWYTANKFIDLAFWHVSTIATMNKNCDGNLFNRIMSQSGPDDTNLYVCDGNFNIFTDLVYFDTPATCNAVNFGADSKNNTFMLWFSYSAGYPTVWVDGGSNYVSRIGGQISTPVAITLANSWETATGFGAAQYYKNNIGEIKLRGSVMADIAGNAIGTLPAGYRPPAPILFITVSGTNNFAVVKINYDGVITPLFMGSTTVSLEGICFRNS